MTHYPHDYLLKRLIYRDGLILIINKPAGMPVHGGPGGGPNLEMFFEALRFGLPRVPHLAHRLDRDTSGCLVLGRHAKALRKMGKLFQAGNVQKTYWAVVIGKMPDKEGVIDLPLAKQELTSHSWWMCVDKQNGLPSVTGYKVMGTGEGPHGPLSWLELYPKTGRTHQIRVHTAALGCPVLGDPIYGPKDRVPLPPLHLHARAIKIPLSASKEPVYAEAPVPEHMQKMLKLCGYKE